MCNHAVKKLPYLLRYVRDQYNTQKMCNKNMLEHCGTLKSVPDYNKNKKCVVKQLIITIMH